MLATCGLDRMKLVCSVGIDLPTLLFNETKPFRFIQ